MLVQLIAKTRKTRLVLHTAWKRCIRDDCLWSNWHAWPCSSQSCMAVLSRGLHVNNDFLLFAIPGRKIIFVRRILVRVEKTVWQMGGVCIFMKFAQSITFAWFMDWVQRTFRAAFAETTQPLSHYPSWQVAPVLESNQLIWAEFNCSKRRTIHVPISN